MSLPLPLVVFMVSPGTAGRSRVIIFKGRPDFHQAIDLETRRSRSPAPPGAGPRTRYSYNAIREPRLNTRFTSRALTHAGIYTGDAQAAHEVYAPVARVPAYGCCQTRI